ncbi:hypothetical protein [Pseudomonas sp. SCB32]|uniref:hypothetical protein n=1 Tax=Pseudomonas sp. SCB32 TaxID=2653853 RepID=UPI0012647405|nr:hypothetical protein [Pseudomonas sp. SCB32]
MTDANRVTGGSSAVLEASGNPHGSAQKRASGRCARKLNVNIIKSRNKFYTTFGHIASRIYPVLKSFAVDELPVKLHKHQSLFTLLQKVQLRPVSEVLSPALGSDVPLTHPVPALTEPPLYATEIRRERAPLAGRSCRYHDESRAARAPRAR